MVGDSILKMPHTARKHRTERRRAEREARRLQEELAAQQRDAHVTTCQGGAYVLQLNELENAAAEDEVLSPVGDEADVAVLEHMPEEGDGEHLPADQHEKDAEHDPVAGGHPFNIFGPVVKMKDDSRYEGSGSCRNPYVLLKHARHKRARHRLLKKERCQT